MQAQNRDNGRNVHRRVLDEDTVVILRDPLSTLLGRSSMSVAEERGPSDPYNRGARREHLWGTRSRGR